MANLPNMSDMTVPKIDYLLEFIRMNDKTTAKAAFESLGVPLSMSQAAVYAMLTKLQVQGRAKAERNADSINEYTFISKDIAQKPVATAQKTKKTETNKKSAPKQNNDKKTETSVVQANSAFDHLFTDDVSDVEWARILFQGNTTEQEVRRKVRRDVILAVRSAGFQFKGA